MKVKFVDTTDDYGLEPISFAIALIPENEHEAFVLSLAERSKDKFVVVEQTENNPFGIDASVHFDFEENVAA